VSGAAAATTWALQRAADIDGGRIDANDGVVAHFGVAPYRQFVTFHLSIQVAADEILELESSKQSSLALAVGALSSATRAAKMSALDEARKEKVMNAMEHTKAFIAAVAEFDADRVRAAAEVRPRPHPSSPTLADFFSRTRLLPIPPAPVSCPDAERVTLT
tara:strand:- start:99 stop:581 length:483 start_codon:yes stop_codon:yes gene_type:complete